MDPRSMNRFLYAEANPATLIDPDGHAALAACEPACGTSDPAANNQLAANKREVMRSEQRPAQRRIDTINATACQRSDVCFVDIPDLGGLKAAPTVLPCILTGRDAGLTQGPDCLAWEGGPPTTTSPMRDQTLFWINAWIGTVESASGRTADVLASRSAASAALAASVDPMTANGQGAWAVRSEYEAHLGRLTKGLSRGLLAVGLLVTAVDAVGSEIQRGSTLGRSGPQIALRSALRFVFTAGGSLGVGFFGAVGGLVVGGPFGSFVGALGAGAAGGVAGNEAFTWIFGE